MTQRQKKKCGHRKPTIPKLKNPHKVGLSRKEAYLQDKKRKSGTRKDTERMKKQTGRSQKRERRMEDGREEEEEEREKRGRKRAEKKRNEQKRFHGCPATSPLNRFGGLEGSSRRFFVGLQPAVYNY